MTKLQKDKKNTSLNPALQEANKPKKQFLLRNLVWNKHFTNPTNRPETIAETLNNELKQDKRIKYSIFTIERGKRQNEQSFHFQGYIEFNNKIDATSFNKEFNFTDIQSRKGSQQQAIDYVNKEKSKISTQVYTFGIPKKQLHKHNTQDNDIPADKQLQEVLINQRLKQNFYSNFNDIENDFEHIFIKQTKWLKNLWDRYHPIKVLDIEPAETIWIYGHSGIGKTTWTNNYLLEKGYRDEQITKQKASSETRPKLWFSLEDEDREVLWIEEIRENFPQFNDIIQIIDKGTRLEVKGSQIDNKYKLIIFNSLHSPGYVYKSLPFGHQVEILRRLYRGNNSKVYEVIPDSKTYNKIIDKTDELPKILLEHYKNQDQLRRHQQIQEWQSQKLYKYIREERYDKHNQTTPSRITWKQIYPDYPHYENLEDNDIVKIYEH